MHLEKTLILPTDDAQLSSALLRDYLGTIKKILFIAIGDDKRTRDTVLKADKLAGKMEDPRWVVWVRSRSKAKSALQEMKLLDATTLKDWSKVLALSVNFKNTVCDVLGNEADPNFTRIFEAYAKSEANPDKEGSTTVPPIPDTE